MDIMWIGLAAMVACAVLGAWVAAQKARGAAEGFLLGLLFGPFGVLIEALLPAPVVRRPAPAVRRRRAQDGHPSQRTDSNQEDRAADWLNP